MLHTATEGMPAIGLWVRPDVYRFKIHRMASGLGFIRSATPPAGGPEVCLACELQRCFQVQPRYMMIGRVPSPALPDLRPVRAENRVRGSDQQSCSPSRPAVMITDHVPAVRLPPDHAGGLMAAACTAPELGALPVTCGLAGQHLRQDRGSWLFVCSI